MLGLTTVACVAHGPAFGDAEASVPVVMRAIHCRGSENDLNTCDYELTEAPGPANETCEDGTGAGAVCVRFPRKYILAQGQFVSDSHVSKRACTCIILLHAYTHNTPNPTLLT